MFRRIVSGALSLALVVTLAAVGNTVSLQKPALTASAAAATSIAKGDAWHYIRTTADGNPTDASWNKTDFDSNPSWVEAATPLGYGYSESNGAPLGTDIGKGDGVLHLYAQKKMQVDSLDNVHSLLLNVDADDEARIYVNGLLVYTKVTDSSVNKAVKAVYPDDPQGGSSGDVYVSAASLKLGENLISVDVKNDRVTSSDLYFDLSLAPSEQEIPEPDYPYEKLIVTPGADETTLRFAWYSDAGAERYSTNFVDAAYNDAAYVVSHGSDGGGFYFNDNNAKTVYKIPLDAAKTGGKLGLDVAANYTIELSSDGAAYTQVAAAPNGAGVGEMGKENRKVEAFSIDDYAAGKEFIWARIGDQTTGNGWGGCIYRVYVSYTDNDGDGEVDFDSKGKLDPKVQLVKTSELQDGEMPEPTDENVFHGYANSAITGKASNKVEVPVEPNTEYAYRIGADSASKWSEVFYTSTESGDDTYSFIYVGDPQLASGEGLAKDTEKWIKTLDLAEKKAAEKEDAAFIFSAGDQVNTGSDEGQYAGLTTPPQMQSIPFAPSIGNHDANDANWTYHYNVPNATGLGKTGAGSDYYFSYGDTLFVALNGNNANCAEHEQAIQRAIESHPDARWKIAVMHQDIYGSGRQHSLKESIYNLRMGMYPLYEKYDFDVVLSGHDHTYTRSYIMKENEPNRDIPENDAGAAIDPPGILYMTANTSAGKYYPLAPVRGVYANVRSQYYVPSYSIVDITDNSFTIKTYRTDTDALYDSYTIQKSATTEDIQGIIAQAGRVEGPCADLDRAVNAAQELVDRGGADEAARTEAFKAVYNAIPRDMIYDGASLQDITFDGVPATIEEYTAYSDSAPDGTVRQPNRKYTFDHEVLHLDGNVATKGTIRATVPYGTDLDAFRKEVAPTEQEAAEQEANPDAPKRIVPTLTEASTGATITHENARVSGSRFTENLVVTSMRGNYSITYAVTVTMQAPRNGWVKDETGVERFYQDDLMQSNTEVFYGDAYYYINADGTRFAGGFAPNGSFYGADGKRSTGGRLSTGGAEYFLDAAGKARTGFIDDGANRYYAGADGKLVKNVQLTLGGATYRFGASGAMFKNTVVSLNGGKVFFAASGALQVKTLVNFGGKTYYAGADGKFAQKKWVTIGKNRYYAGADGALYKKTVRKIGKKTYAFNAAGVMLKGKKLVTVGKNRYYVDKKGYVALKKRVKVKGKYYYADKKGRIVKNKKVKIGKKLYKANRKGVLKRVKK